MQAPSLSRFLFVSLAALAPACGGAAGAAERAPSGVLVIALDGLRADHVSAYGYDRETTPNIDALAAEGLVFEQAFTAAPLARPAHIGLLTGCEPRIAERFAPEDLGAKRWFVPTMVPRLAVEFLAAGYRTAAFVDSSDLDPQLGLDAGFQRYVMNESASAREPQTPMQVQRLVAWLRSTGRHGSWFAYLHLADLERSWRFPESVHERRFQPPRPELAFVPPVVNGDRGFFAIPYSRWRASRSLGEYELAYDGRLAQLDETLATLFAELRRMSIDDRTTIVVVGTHGVQFGEAGLFLTSGGYSMADLSVPLIVRPRAGVGGGGARRTDDLFALIDLAPTLLALEDVERPRGMHGREHVDVLKGEPRSEPVRPFAFSSCGLQDGLAVIGATHCLEYFVPAKLDDELVRSWFGRDEAPGIEPVSRFYDRIATPFPAAGVGVSLDAGEGAEPGAKAFREARSAWVEWVTDVRALVQGGVTAPSISPSRRAELLELGYIGDEL